MKTISLIILLITLCMWIIRIYKFKNKEITEFNPFKDETHLNLVLIFLTVYSILIILLGGLQYLT